MPSLPTHTGPAILVDVEDFTWLEQYRLYVQHLPSDRRRVSVWANHRLIQLGRFLLEHHGHTLARTDAVQHLNENYLDFQKANLKALPRKKLLTLVSRPRGRHKYIGVSFSKQFNRWRARCQHDGKMYEESAYTDEAAAALGFDIMALKLHGEHATLNFPERRAELIRHIGHWAVGKGLKNYGKRRTG